MRCNSIKKIVVISMICGLFVTGCSSGKEAVTNGNDNPETKTWSMEESQVNSTLSNDDKEMMAGGTKETESTVENTTESTEAESEKKEEQSNTLVFGDINVEIIPDRNLAKTDGNTEYGELVHVKYYSSTCEKDRWMNVLLPAGYSEDKQYPVLYILHGIFGDEYSMCGDGKSGLPVMLGNLMSQDVIDEMIVVFPHMYASKIQDQCTGINIENIVAYDNFVNDLTEDIMPYIKENYSILEGKENTAITGFSMGGRESLAIGLLRPDLFGYVGAVAPAPGLVPGKDMYMDHPGQFTPEQVVYADEKPFLIMICAGDRDSVVGKFPKNYHELYEENGIEHIWWEIPGSDHGEPAISSGIYNFTRYIFSKDINR